MSAREAFQVIHLLISRAAECYATQGTLTEDLLSQLYKIFGSTLPPALDLMQDGLVTQVVAERSQRTLFQVRGSSNFSYVVLAPVNRCSCPSWFFKSWTLSDKLTCKHVLAVKLASAVQDSCDRYQSSHVPSVLRKVSVSEDCFVQIMAGID